MRYGKSNSQFSFLYDPLYTIKTTLAGQLALCMLSERLFTGIPEMTMLQINTDGLTVRIPHSEKENYWEICQQWEEETGLLLEYVAYSKMIIRDVNSYLAVDKDGKVKYKGAFKTNEEMIKDGEYHKSFSQGIVPLALSKFFLDGIPVEETVKNHTNIFDFCKTFNASHGWKCETLLVDGNGAPTDVQEEQKTNRYYISKDGKTFRKYKDEKFIDIEANGTKVTIINTYDDQPIDSRNIDYDYYINECYKIIHRIDGTTERMEMLNKLKREQAKLEKEENDYVKHCVEKSPTELQFDKFKRDWLIEKYGVPPVIKPSKRKSE